MLHSVFAAAGIMGNIKKIVAAALVLAVPCFASAEITASFAKELDSLITFENLEMFYAKHECSEKLNKRSRNELLVVLNDVAAGAIGSDSYSYDVIGDINVFTVGREVNTQLVRFYEYAQRQDVREEINKDQDAIRKQVSLNSFDDRSLTLVVCDLYSVIVGEPAEATDAFSKYVDGLNKKILHKNLDRLQKLTKDFQ